MKITIKREIDLTVVVPLWFIAGSLIEVGHDFGTLQYFVAASHLRHSPRSSPLAFVLSGCTLASMLSAAHVIHQLLESWSTHIAIHTMHDLVPDVGPGLRRPESLTRPFLTNGLTLGVQVFQGRPVCSTRS